MIVLLRSLCRRMVLSLRRASLCTWLCGRVDLGDRVGDWNVLLFSVSESFQVTLA